MISEIKYTCTGCGEQYSVTVYDSINAAETPELKAAVLDGSAFVRQCPHCGCPNLLRYRMLYHDPSEKLMIWLTCGSEELEEQVRGVYGSIEELKDYTTRFVDDAGSLIEKLKIFDAGLDDVIVEMTKYVTKLELCEKDKEHAEAILDAQFKFFSLDGADNLITLAYPADGQMQMVEVGFNVYEDCRGIVKRNPAITEAASGFVKVNKDWLAKYVR